MNWKLILQIISWATPVLIGALILISNHKVNKYEQEIKLKKNKRIKNEIKKNIQKWKYVGWGAIPLGSLLILIAQSQINKIDELKIKEDKLRSSLYGTIKTPSVANDGEMMKIQIGSDIYKQNIIRNQDITVNPFQMYGIDYPFKVKFINGKLMVTAEVTSFDGKIVAKITDNLWEINPNNYFKRNYDDFGLEIIGDYGYPILQLEMKDQNTLRIAGMIYKKNILYVISEQATYINSTSIEGIPEILKKFNIKEMYNYPSDEHFGQRKKMKS